MAFGNGPEDYRKKAEQGFGACETGEQKKASDKKRGKAPAPPEFQWPEDKKPGMLWEQD